MRVFKKRFFYRLVSIVLAFVISTSTPLQVFAQSSSPSNNINYLEDPYTKVDLDTLLNLAQGDEDTDGDGLPDIVERVLGTDENNSDSDYDQVDDYFEAKNGLDPLNIDTNYDGIGDFYEVSTENQEDAFDITLDADNDGIANYLDFDNDGDNVRDGIDISPFSRGKLQDVYKFNIKTEGKATFAELQIKPKSLTDNTLYSNNQIYDWPHDTKGSIQDLDMSTNDMSLRPMLEVKSDHLPTQEDCEKFGIMLDRDRMYIPLNDVYDSGQKVALSGTIYIPEGITETNLEAKLVWTIESEVDQRAKFSKSAIDVYGTTKEYASAGTDTARIDSGNEQDLVLLAVESRNGDDSFWYSVWFNIDETGKSSEMTPMYEIPVTLPSHSEGGGLAIGDLNGNGTPDLLCVSVEKRDGSDKFVYTIGYDIDENGQVPSNNWSSLIDGPEVGHSNDGAGAAISDLDGNGMPELIFMTCDNPSGSNKIWYTILWNYDNNQAPYSTNSWDPFLKVPIAGSSQEGAGIEVVDLDGDSNKEFVFMIVDNPDEDNVFRYYVAWDINCDETSSNRGKFSSLSNQKVPPIELGNSSQGGSIAIDDFNNDGNQDMLLVNVDDPSGDNIIWYYVGENIDINGDISTWSERRTYSGVKDGLRDSIDIPWDIEAGVGCATKDIDKNGKDELIVMWAYYHPYREGYTRFYYSIGWDMDEDGQVRGWSETKEIYHDWPDTENIEGLALDMVDFNNDNNEDLYVAALINNKVYHEIIHNFGSGSFGYEALETIDLVNQNPQDAYDLKIRGLGATWAKVDGKNIDLVLSYSNTYAFRNVTGQRTDTFYPHDTFDLVDYNQYHVNKATIFHDGDINVPESIVLNEYHEVKSVEEAEGDAYSRYEPIGTRDYNVGTGLVIDFFNDDDELDLLMVGSDYAGRGFYSQQIYSFKDGIEAESRNSVDNRKSNLSIQNREEGVGIATCDLDDNNSLDAIGVTYENDEFNLYVSKNIETSQVPVLKDYDDFQLVGLKVNEYNSVKSNFVHIEKNSSEDNARKVMSVNEILRGHYLKQDFSIDEAIEIIGKSEAEDGYEIEGVQIEKYTFSHIEEALYGLNNSAEELFSSGNGSHIPVVIASENNTRSVTLDSCGNTVVTGDTISIDLNQVDYIKTRLLQLKWYDSEENKFNSAQDIVEGVNADWGWSLDDETCVDAISLLVNWDVGELRLHEVGTKCVLPTKPAWSQEWWSKVAVKSGATFADLFTYGRQAYRGLKFSRSILENSNGVVNVSKYLVQYYKLTNNTRLSDFSTQKLYRVISQRQYHNLKAKFVSGPKLTKLAKVVGFAGFASEFGMAIYMGVKMGSQFEDDAYGHYAGFIYGAFSGTFAAIKYLMPIMASLKMGATASGVGAILVALIELSDFLTFLTCNKSWSSMMISAIFNALVGKSPEVEVDLKQIAQNTEYKDMENGLFVTGSKVVYTGEFDAYVKDADNDNYDDKSDIDENYIKPIIKYQSSDPAVEITNDTDKGSDSWSGSHGSYTLKNKYNINNSIRFVKPDINTSVKSIQNVKTHIKIDKKGGSDYFETDTETNTDYLYFDVLPTKLEEFREYFNFASSYSSGNGVESKAESEERIKNNTLVHMDEDGDGLLLNGTIEMTHDGQIVDSDPTKRDTDGDNVDDYMEFLKGGNPRSVDTDGDGLEDDIELLLGTEIAIADTDEDGRNDGEELAGYDITIQFKGQIVSISVYSDPLNADRDGDGVNDLEEFQNGTNPNAKSTNGMPKWDTNQYDPHLTNEIDEINNIPVNDSVVLQLNDYFSDNDGDELSFEVSSGEVDENGNFEYIYEGSLVIINVIVSDNRGGKYEYDFFVNDTTNPYVRATQFGDSQTRTDAINEATWVDGDSELYIYFNEDITLINQSEIQLYDTEKATQVPCNVTASGNLIIITPIASLEEDETLFKITIGMDALTDLNTNKQESDYIASFTTKDTTEPQLQNTKINGDFINNSTTIVTPSDEIIMQYQENIKPLYEISYSNTLYPQTPKVAQWSYDTIENQLVFNVEQDILLDNTSYTIMPSIQDKHNNTGSNGNFTFITGDVNAPKIDTLTSGLVPYSGYQEFEKNSYYLKTETPNEIVITYDENIYEGSNFNAITLTVDGLNINSVKSYVLDNLPENQSGIKEELEDINLEEINITTTIRNGNELVITLSSPLIISRPYTLTIPTKAIKDINDLNVLHSKWINITYSSSEKPIVRWSGAKTNGKIIIEDQSVLDPVEDIVLVFNQLIQSSSNFDDIVVKDENNITYQGHASIGITGEDKGSYDLRFRTWDELEPNKNYTLIVPANSVENAWGESNDEYTKTFTTSATIGMPGLNVLDVIGIPRIKERIYGHYLFEKYNNMVEGISEFQWYRCDDELGNNKIAIQGATSIVYDVTEDDLGKYLFFEITPKLEEDNEGIVESLPSSITAGFGPVEMTFSEVFELGILEVKEGDNTLLSLTENIGNYYELEVNTDVSTVSIQADAQDNKAFVDVEYYNKLEENYGNNNGAVQDVKLELGYNLIEIIVYDEAGKSFNNYTVCINRNTDDEETLKPDSYAEITLAENQGQVYSVGDVLTGNYYVYDDENRKHGEHQLNWYNSDYNDGTSLKLVGQGLEYQVTIEDMDKYIYFEIIPETESGVVGNEYLSAPMGPIDNEAPKDISSLSIKQNSSELIDNFNKEMKNYIITVPLSITSVDMELIFNDNAQIKINDEIYLGGIKQLSLPSSRNLFIVDILDGQDIVDSYYVTINKTSEQIPSVNNVDIEGVIEIGEVLSGTYDFVGTEGNSTYLWYRADSNNSEKRIVSTGTNEYIIKESDYNKHLFFEVQPISTNGIVGNSKISTAFVIGDSNPDNTTPSATFIPINGATGVEANTNITVEFDESIRLIDNSDVNNSNIDTCFTLQDTNNTDVDFDATISGNTVTIVPNIDLANGESYTVTIVANSLEDMSDNIVANESATFTIITAQSVPLAGTVTITNDGTPQYDEVLMVDTSNISNNSGTLSYQWKRENDSIGTDSNQYTITEDDIGNNITVEVTSSAQTGTLTSSNTITPTKADYTGNITVPQESIETHNSITLLPTLGYEYRKDGGAWQTSNVFNGLTQSTSYTFTQRVKETVTTYQSVESDGTTIKTLAQTTPGVGDGGSSTPSVPGAKTISSSKKGKDTTFTIKHEDVKVEFNGLAFEGVENKKVQLKIEEADKGDLDISKELEEQIGDLPIFDISIYVDGEKEHFESNEPIVIEIPVNTELPEHKVVAVYIDENGDTQIMEGVFYGGVMRFITYHLSDYALVYVDKTFADVTTHWGKEAIEALASREVVNGVGNDMFNPEGEITRAEFATIMVRYFGLNVCGNDLGYTDIKEDSWYSEYVWTARENGILPEIYGDTFEPNKAITREEMMYILFKSLVVTDRLDTLADNSDKLSDFTDSGMVSDYAVEGSEYLISRDVINGSRNNMFSPTSTATRAEVTQMIWNIITKNNFKKLN